MGKRGSSSKKKPYSKKKTSKILFERRKRSSRRNKSKKLRRRGDSVSSYSYDDSRSSVSVSSSSSEDNNKSRKARSRTRIGGKSGRKRGRRSPSSRENSDDSLRIRKKGSKRNHNSEKKKKTQKKRPRRDASISSTSCSTCQGRSSSSSSEESEVERSRGRSRENKKDKITSVRPRSESKYSRKRSASCSSYSRYSGNSGNHIESTLATDNNLKRLRSVISIANQSEEKEENKCGKDEHKEEITYDHDDYPSCRSNESNDGGSKKELSHHSRVVSEKRRKVENIKGRTPFLSNPATPVYTKSGKNGASQHDTSNLPPAGIVSSHPKTENVKEVSSANAGSDGNDLESILRQKALENLRRFKGGVQTNSMTLADQKNKDDGDVKQFSTAKDKFVQIQLPNQDGSGVVVATLANESSLDTPRSQSSCPTVISGKIPEPDGAAVSGNTKDKSTGARSVNDKAEPRGSKWRQEYSGTDSTLKQATTIQISSKAITSENANLTSQAIAKSGSDNHSTGVNDAGGSATIEPFCIKPTSEEHSSNEKQDEAKDGSQFEHKTMSVMRGGEMVQVSYKVKIPKRAPAFARRQLKR